MSDRKSTENADVSMVDAVDIPAEQDLMDTKEPEKIVIVCDSRSVF